MGFSVRSWLSVSISSALLVGGATAAQAQQVSYDAPRSGPEAADAQPDVVVTAQRREQSLQDVPISITALGGDTLRDANIVRADDLPFLVPSLTLLGNNTPQGTLNLIRGVGTFSYSDAVESSVGTVIDGVVLGRQGMGLINLFDVERVEVLKGPQGTLFGKNASAGLINIVTRRPEFTFGGTAEILYGNYDEVLANAAVTGPVADGVAFRLTGHFNKRDGFVDQPARGGRINNVDRFGGRAKLLIRPEGGRGDLLLTAEYYEVDEDCCHWTVREFGAQAPLIGPGGLFPLVTEPGPGNRVSASESPVFNRSKIFGASAEANLELGRLTLTSVTGYRHWRNRNGSEADGTPLPILGAPGDEGRAEYDQFSQELRVASPASEPVYFTAGLYGFLIDTRSTGRTFGNLGLAPPVIPPGFLFTSANRSRSQTHSYGVFGEVAFRATDKLLVTIGGRVVHEILDARFDRAGNFPLPGTTLADVNAQAARRDDTDFVARGVVQYDWTDDVMTYASVARGYKGFGADTSSPLPNIQPGGYGATFVRPETSLAYEVGAKTRLFDRRLTLNASAFWTDFDDFQTTLFNPVVAQFVLLNADKYRTRGVEVDFSFTPVRGVTLSGAGAYVDAEPRRFPNVPCTPSPSPLPCVNGLRNVSGATAPLSPTWAFNVAADLETRLPSSEFGLFGRVDFSWKDDILYDFDQDPRNVQEAFGLLNARAGLSFRDDRLRIAAYGRNLTNRKWTNLIFDTPVWGGYAQYPEIGRTYGLQVSARL
jgi:iron complex outermembrane receptor protein